MSDKNDKSAQPKKRPKLFKMLLMGVLLAGAGGGTVFGLMAAGILGDQPAKAEEAGPQLVLKGEEDSFAPPAKAGKEAAPVVYGEGGSKYRTAYHSFAEEFTSNLRNTDALVQVSLAASTRRDGRVLMWLAEHELAIRSRILVALADTPEEDIYSPEGKERLQKRLTKAVNDVLVEQEGFGGVDAVHFRTFIVQ
ncbi:flagellar basal body-associated protein FliL [Altererythrobacter soli]|uniref:Flagellar protein FliL n=1 Tax=Croceibacterium soli TaxID=1739690 RepID=A0A6I4UX61_9SPHN|nr:flagellar basal body-associated FliL family protein [Croceibacterium soli]MXP41575.1 flagellar basal body-associated protein FliL [Croceibacterium soli]